MFVLRGDLANFAESYLVSLLLNGFFVFWLVGFARKRERFLQTFTAMLGASCVVLIAQIVVAVIATGGGSVTLGQILFEFVVLWSLLIDAYILSRALEIAFLFGGLIAFGLFLMQLNVLRAIAGGA
ncbi:MAG: hypothetical protein AAF290_09985 [Pseudomonadota bacterium]